jgi:pimeloyl-ACP methyl ester carboxylesterase
MLRTARTPCIGAQRARSAQILRRRHRGWLEQGSIGARRAFPYITGRSSVQRLKPLLETPSRARHSPSSDEHAIEEALRARIARPSSRVARRTARIVFDASPAGTWTLDIQEGSIRLSRGAGGRASATISSDPGTLLEVLTGRVAGVEAFLQGRLTLRGNIALTLELDDLLHPAAIHPRAPRCARVSAGGVGSFYLEAGPANAPPVVLLHGLGATSASFLPTIWDLAQDFHVLAVDLPGFGESDKPVRRLHPAYFARWARAFLDAVGVQRSHFVGNSMGGRVALEVGLRAPERVDRLVLLAPSLAWRRYRLAAGLVRLLRPEIAALPMPIVHRFVVAFLRSMFARPERVSVAAMNGAADEFVRIFGTPRGRIAFFHAAREIYLEDPHGTRGFWDRLPGLSRPSLFLFGDRDWLVPKAFARHVRLALPGAGCETFHDCGHVPQFEFPARTNARIREFLRG